MILLGGVTLAGWLVAAAMLAAGLRRIPTLPPRPAGTVPDVTLVVAARNEARHVEEAVRSLLDQTHPDLRVVVVNDRSEDATGEIVDRLAADAPALRVVHVDGLPDGWLGKNHALHLGAAGADTEYLVFADADILMAPEAVAIASGYAHANDLDHLAAFPRMRARGWLLNATIGVFTILFSLRFRPWRASDPESDAHVGVGAFNLVRTAAYRAVGGHRTISLRPDDDVRLGRIVKEAGFRSTGAYAHHLLEVEWYPDVRALIRGLRKNAFAAVEYNAPLVALVLALLAAFHIWPFLAVFLVSGPARALFGGAALVACGCFLASAARFGVRPLAAPLYPVGAAIVAYAIGAATLRALATGGVEWRGTVYPLESLRRGDPAMRDGPPAAGAPPAPDARANDSRS